MTNTDKLNTASDLRRIAYWLATKDISKKNLIDKLWHNIKNKKEVKSLTDKYLFQPKPNAEEFLMLSQRLQNS